MDNAFLDNETGGISAGEGSRVVGNTVRGSGRTGISARTGCLIRDNVVSRSANSGIYAEFGCLLEGNVAFANNLSDTTDGYGGFKVVGDCLVRGNLARDNRRDFAGELPDGAAGAGNAALPHWTAPATAAATAAPATSPGPVPTPSGDRR